MILILSGLILALAWVSFSDMKHYRIITPKHLLATVIGFLFCIVVTAQSKNEAAVSRAVELLKKGMITGDQKQLESIAADNLSYGHSGGKIENKMEFIEAFVSGKSNFESIDITDQTIMMYGNTAVVRHKLHGATNDLGKEPGTVNLSILLVWVKVKGSWQLAARQAVKI